MTTGNDKQQFPIHHRVIDDENDYDDGNNFEEEDDNDEEDEPIDAVEQELEQQQVEEVEEVEEIADQEAEAVVDNVDQDQEGHIYMPSMQYVEVQKRQPEEAQKTKAQLDKEQLVQRNKQLPFQRRVVLTSSKSYLKRIFTKKRYYLILISCFWASSLFQVYFQDLGPFILFNNNRSNNKEEEQQGNGTSSFISNTNSLINDKTLYWDPTVRRLWLNPIKERPPPLAMLLLLTDGWNQVNQTKGLKLQRLIRETELLEGVINHPWFHPNVSLNDVIEGRKTNTRYYIFLDRPTCAESNYPNYGGSYKGNIDFRHNRSVLSLNYSNAQVYHDYGGRVIDIDNIAKRMKQMITNLMNTNNTITVVLFHCNGDYKEVNINNRKQLPVSVAALDGMISKMANEEQNQGLPPPMVTQISLSEEERRGIENCDAETSRSLHAVYIGNLRNGQNSAFHEKHSGGARYGYKPFHDNNTTFILGHHKPEFNESAIGHLTYREILRKTIFGIAPRGDNKFSYRFSEVLSAGAIPVVHSDDWIWPFRPELVDWSMCAVVLPEKDSGKVALDILRNMTKEERCYRRQNCYRIYTQYMETPTKVISGLIEGLELVGTAQEKINNTNSSQHKKMFGISCKYVDFDCNMKRL